MDEITLLHRFPGSQIGFCPDCVGDRLLLPADPLTLEFCCADCDAAVLFVELEKRPRGHLLARAG